MLGFLGGGGAGLLTGPGAPAAVPTGAYAGAAGGAVAGGATGAAIGTFIAKMMDGDGGDNFDKMRQGDNTSKNKQFKDAFKKIQKDLGKKLTRKQQRQLHDYITNQGYDGFWEIYDAGMELFGGCE